MYFILKKIVILMVIGGCFACTGCKNSTAEDSIVEESDNSLSGKDTEYLARRICTGCSANDFNSFEGSNGELYAQAGWDYLKVNGQWYFFENPGHRLEISFKSLDENTGVAYFYATANVGYYIQNGNALVLPAEINASNLELNPETNYWRYK